MALIEAGHLFSQHSLNTYLRCKRRFWLKYIAQQPWPMPEQENLSEYQAHLARGRTFHQWVARALLGVDADLLGQAAAACGDEALLAWWLAFGRFDLSIVPEGLREVELPLIVPLGEYRLYARYDLVAFSPSGEAVIVDWKTLERLPSWRVMRERVQTRVYLYVLASAGHIVTGGAPLDPSRLEMIYWFAPFEEMFRIPYSRREFQAHRQALLRLVEEIAASPPEAFVPTENPRECAFCNYRSLCGRQEAPRDPSLNWLDEEIDFALDLDEAIEMTY